MYRTDAVGSGLTPSLTAPEPAGATLAASPVFAIKPLGRGAKRLFDIAGALCFFSLGLPLYLGVALCVCLSSPGPVHYWQFRVGQNGRRFRFYKFRSMVQDSEEVLSSLLESDDDARAQWETYQKLDDDPRITKVGRWIRRTSLDELPQFWNVLKGDMSLVGPRPCMEQQSSLYGENWAVYCAVKPGLTGLWQVSGRNRLSYLDRVELDRSYVTNWTFRKDLQILFRTVAVVFTGDGSR